MGGGHARAVGTRSGPDSLTKNFTGPGPGQRPSQDQALRTGAWAYSVWCLAPTHTVARCKLPDIYIYIFERPPLFGDVIHCIISLSYK